MFDIGIGEIIVIAVVALLIFGSDRLPRAAADAARWVKQLREMASGARKDLADSAGLDLSDAMDTVRSLQDLHPRRLAAGLLDDDAEAKKKPAAGSPPAAGPTPPKPETPAYDPDAT